MRVLEECDLQNLVGEFHRARSRRVFRKNTSSGRKRTVPFHFSVNYQQSNSIAKQDVYQLPHMYDCFDALGHTAALSREDVDIEYCQAEKKRR